MTIEKAFAINAEPDEIWQALWSDLSQGDPDAFDIEGTQWPRSISLRVKLGAVPVLLTYTIERQQEYTEVAARLTPLSSLYGLFQIMTFGHLRRNFEMLLVQGLDNLKRSLEGDEGDGYGAADEASLLP